MYVSQARRGDEAIVGGAYGTLHDAPAARLNWRGFDIADEHDSPVYRVGGKALRLRETFVIGDLQGREVNTIRDSLLFASKSRRTRTSFSACSSAVLGSDISASLHDAAKSCSERAVPSVPRFGSDPYTVCLGC
jgi:hypothetical protein